MVRCLQCSSLDYEWMVVSMTCLLRLPPTSVPYGTLPPPRIFGGCPSRYATEVWALHSPLLLNAPPSPLATTDSCSAAARRLVLAVLQVWFTTSAVAKGQQ